MMPIGEAFLAMQIIAVTVVSVFFLILALMDKDELEKLAFDNALKTSVIIVILSIFGYGLYRIASGCIDVSVHAIFYGIEGICILTLLLYYLDLKDVRFEFRMKNIRLANSLMYISTGISILAIISLLFEFKFFENTKGFIRYDELVLMINAILISIIIPVSPKRKKMNREAYKKMEGENKKFFNMTIAIYGIVMVLIVFYLFNKKIGL